MPQAAAVAVAAKQHVLKATACCLVCKALTENTVEHVHQINRKPHTNTITNISLVGTNYISVSECVCVCVCGCLTNAKSFTKLLKF